MKIQNTQTHRNGKLSLLVVTIVMLAMLLCSFTVMASAAGQTVNVDLEDLTIALEKDGTGTYYKEYDGTTDVTVSLKSTNAELGIASGDDVTVTVTAAYADANVADDNSNYVLISLELTGADAEKYALSTETITVGAYVAPKKVTWADTAKAEASYKPEKTSYDVTVNLPAVNGVLEADKAKLPKTANVSVQAIAAGKVSTSVAVDLGKNYVIDPLAVEVTVTPVTITEILWENGYVFDINDLAARQIAVYGKDAAGTKYLLNVSYPADYATVPNTWYEITVAPVDANFKIADGVAVTHSVKITASYKVSFNDTVFAGNANSAQNPTNYMITVNALGDTVLPADLLAKLTYTVDGNAFTGTTASGVYKVVVVIPDGYELTDANGKAYNNTDNQLSATLTVNTNAVNAQNKDMPYQIILTGSVGVSPGINATVVEADLARKAVKGFPRHEGYEISITNAGTGTYSVIIGINDTLVHTRADALTANDLYIYDQLNGTMVKATERYTVTYHDGYYEVAGLSGDATLTFVIAPVYHVHFLLTAPGIALIILLIIALLIILVLIGLAKRKEKKNADKEEETEEIAPIVPDTVDEEEVLEALAEEAAEEIAEDVAAEEEATEENTEGTDEAVAEAMAELLEEASQEVLETEETDVPEQMAEQMAEELADEVEAEDAEAEADADALAAAVAEAMEDALNESADATDAVALEEESVEAFAAVESEEDDNDDDDDDNAFAGFSTAGLKFIDIMAEPEAYQELLLQEQNGEVQLVYRYRRSYESRMIQSQGSVQEYYNVIKNALLSYKGIKARTSWNYEAFNRGRVHVAKMNAKTKTLYLYLALDPEELQDTKYGIIDVSSKKKYASVPVLMKIKGDRKFKYALELIEKLCAEQIQLPKLANAEEVDYTVPYQTTDELVESGLVKKLVAAIPLNPPTEEPVEEEAVVEEEAPATEAENVTFVAPTDAPAVAAVAEEAAEEPAAEDPSKEA